MPRSVNTIIVQDCSHFGPSCFVPDARDNLKITHRWENSFCKTALARDDFACFVCCLKPPCPPRLLAQGLRISWRDLSASERYNNIWLKERGNLSGEKIIPRKERQSYKKLLSQRRDAKLGKHSSCTGHTLCDVACGVSGVRTLSARGPEQCENHTN